MTARPILLRVLFFRDPGAPDAWVAQALEYDIAAYGKDVEQAKSAFERTVSGYIVMAQRRDESPFATLAPAPDDYWKVWARVAARQTIEAEPFPSMPGHIIRAVSDEPVSATH